MKQRKSVLAFLLAVVLVLPTAAFAAEGTHAGLPFKDVADGAWYADAVVFVYEKGLMAGKSFSGLEVDHGKAVASAFAGMTVAQFNAYIHTILQQNPSIRFGIFSAMRRCRP